MASSQYIEGINRAPGRFAAQRSTLPGASGSLIGTNGRSTGAAALKHISVLRGLENQGEDEPNTPSKNKMMPRRPLGLYALLLLFTIIGGLFIFRRDAGPIRDDAYYRKVLVSKMYSTGSGQGVVTDFEAPGVDVQRRAGLRTNVENSEARQREALEIADRILHNQHTLSPVAIQQLGELVAGGGSVTTNPADVLPTPGSSGHAGAANQHGSTLPNPTRKATTTITQVLSNGEERQVVVDANLVSFLDSMSNGLESQDIELDDPDHLGWWSDVIASDGERAPKVSRPSTRPTAALSTAQALTAKIESGNGTGPEEDETQCKIAILDVTTDLTGIVNNRRCELGYKRVWPFSRNKYGIDGVDTLPPEHYQYSQEYWISQSIRSSSRYTPDIASADFVFVDMWCYHVEWLAYIHPLGNRNATNPEPYVRRSLNAIVKMDKFLKSKGGDFGLVHPSPVMKGLFSEEALCEDLASVYNMVPERSSLCVWTPDSPAEGKDAIIPYLATLDLDLENDLQSAADRDLFMFFRGGCGHPDPSIRNLFAAGKMMRYELVAALDALGDDDVHAECSCDICDNHMPHPEVQDGYRRAKFCPVMPSNVQSSRRLSEVILAGCVPVFFGPPFHTLPLAQFVDYTAIGIFFNISQPTWMNDSSSNHVQNHMVGKVWRLDDPRVESSTINVETLYEAIAYLREMSEEAVAAKRRAVLAERWKFYYGPVPEAQGGDGRTSALGELLMQQMCKRAAATKRRLSQAAAQGVDIADSDVQIQQASVKHQRSSEQKSNSGWSMSLFGGNKR